MGVPSDLATPKRAARQLGLHAATLRRWVREGRVKGYRLTGGRRRWVSVGECRQQLAARGGCGYDENGSTTAVTAMLGQVVTGKDAQDDKGGTGA